MRPSRLPKQSSLAWMAIGQHDLVKNLMSGFTLKRLGMVMEPGNPAETVKLGDWPTVVKPYC
jgi:hypothetical protein